MGKGKNYSSSYKYHSGGKSSSYSSPSAGQKASSYSSYSSYSGGGKSSMPSSSSAPSSSYYANKPVVYSLNLDGGRKYVGKTNNFPARMDQHFGGTGAKWTQQNK